MAGDSSSRELLSPFLDVVFDEFFCVLLEDVVDLIDELVNVFLDFLAGLNDFRIGLNVVFRLRFSSGLLLSFLFLHPSTSRGSGNPRRLANQRDPVGSPYPTVLSAVKPG